MGKKSCLVLICICVLTLPLVGLFFENARKPKIVKYENVFEVKSNPFSLSRSNIKKSESKMVKVYTYDVNDGKGKMNVEISSNGESQKYVFDIIYNGYRWSCIGNMDNLNQDALAICLKAKENVEKQTASQISLNYSYSYSSYKSN